MALSKAEIARILADPGLREAALKMAETRTQRKTTMDPTKALFAKQRAFVESKAKMKVALCSRRAGKSHGLAYMAIQAALQNPNSIIPYCALTAKSGKEIFYKPMVDICNHFNIPFEYKTNLGKFVFPETGSQVIIYGVGESAADVEKLRGLQFPLAIIDEGQSFPPHIQKLIDDVIEPATLDTDGQIVMAGTPGPTKFGYYYDACEGKRPGWEVHKWTVLDNDRMVVDPAVQLKKILERRGWTERTPQFRREYRGEWTEADGSLVYAMPQTWNGTPADYFGGPYQASIGLDLGYSDPSAFIVLYHDFSGRFLVSYEHQESEMLPTQIASHLDVLSSVISWDTVYVDTAGYGKSIAESLTREHSVPVTPAQKTDKLAAIETLNDAIKTGRLQVMSGAAPTLLYQMANLQWDVRKKESGLWLENRNTCANHLCDALLYVHRGISSYIEGRMYQREAEKSAADLDEARMRRLEVELSTKKKEKGYLL